MVSGVEHRERIVLADRRPFAERERQRNDRGKQDRSGQRDPMRVRS